jgi:hypothetical protein
MDAVDVAKAFMKCWQAQEFRSCDVILQKTFISNHPEWLDYINTIFNQHQLKKWKLIKDVRIGDCARDVVFKIELDQFKTEIKLRCLREDAPYSPAVSGVWGVNPISILKGL